MDNRAIITELVEAFDKADTEVILNHVTEDIQWHILGEFLISGKEEMKKFFNNAADMNIISCTKDHILLDGDQVAVDGEMKCTGKDNVVYDMYYCDVYDLINGKVRKMTSYTVNKKKEN